MHMSLQSLTAFAIQTLAIPLICFAVQSRLSADETWPQFRGAAGNGVATDAALPTEWGPERNIAWKVRIPGVGWSQPIVWRDRVFLTTAVAEKQAKPSPENNGPGFGGLGDFNFGAGGVDLQPPQSQYRWQLLCLDAKSGETVWTQTAHEGRPSIHIHPNNTYASETPATDGERVIAYFGMTGVYCYDLAGQPLWSKDLGVFPTQFGWGTGSSPVIWEDRVFIQCDNDQASFLVALDKRTGDEIWRVDRDEKSNWSTPYLWINRLRTELILAGGNRLRSYDPKSGELLWEMKGQGRASVTPIGNEELLFVDSADRLTGIRGRIHAVRAGAKGDISVTRKEGSNEFVAWSAPLNASHLSSPLLWRDRLFVFEQGAIVHCYDAKTGEEFERQRLQDVKGFVSSPVVAGDKAYCLDQTGTTLVLEIGEKLKTLATNKLDEMCWSTPAVGKQCLFLRGVDHLYCVHD